MSDLGVQSLKLSLPAMTEEDFETVLEAEHQRIDEARPHYVFTIAMSKCMFRALADIFLPSCQDLDRETQITLAKIEALAIVAVNLVRCAPCLAWRKVSCEAQEKDLKERVQLRAKAAQTQWLASSVGRAS